MGDPQFLFCIFQQGDEGSLAPISQLATGDGDIEPILPENSVPVGSDAAKTSCRETS